MPREVAQLLLHRLGFFKDLKGCFIPRRGGSCQTLLLDDLLLEDLDRAAEFQIPLSGRFVSEPGTGWDLKEVPLGFFGKEDGFSEEKRGEVNLSGVVPGG